MAEEQTAGGGAEEESATPPSAPGGGDPGGMGGVGTTQARGRPPGGVSPVQNDEDESEAHPS